MDGLVSERLSISGRREFGGWNMGFSIGIG